MKRFNRTFAPVLIATGLLGVAGMTIAGDDNGSPVKTATSQTISMEEMIRNVEREHGGKVVEAEFEASKSVYEIKSRDGDGQLRERYYDAHSGELLKTEIEDD